MQHECPLWVQLLCGDFFNSIGQTRQGDRGPHALALPLCPRKRPSAANMQFCRSVPIAAICKAARWRLKLASMAVKTEPASTQAPARLAALQGASRARRRRQWSPIPQR